VVNLLFHYLNVTVNTCAWADCRIICVHIITNVDWSTFQVLQSAIHHLSAYVISSVSKAIFAHYLFDAKNVYVLHMEG